MTNAEYYTKGLEVAGLIAVSPLGPSEKLRVLGVLKEAYEQSAMYSQSMATRPYTTPEQVQALTAMQGYSDSFAAGIDKQIENHQHKWLPVDLTPIGE